MATNAERLCGDEVFGRDAEIVLAGIEVFGSDAVAGSLFGGCDDLGSVSVDKDPGVQEFRGGNEVRPGPGALADLELEPLEGALESFALRPLLAGGDAYFFGETFSNTGRVTSISHL